MGSYWDSVTGKPPTEAVAYGRGMQPLPNQSPEVTGKQMLPSLVCQGISQAEPTGKPKGKRTELVIPNGQLAVAKSSVEKRGEWVCRGKGASS